jgi:1-deoxy-D-xylulose-5-phosphate reductoisomerase
VNRAIVPLFCDPVPEPSRVGEPLGVSVLGSTGSIGRQTLDVIAQHPDRFKVVALAAGAKLDTLASQIAQFQPDLVAVEIETGFDKERLKHPRILFGKEGLIAVATHANADIVVIATSGHAAIIPTAKAIESRKTVALANKETIVCAGALIAELAHNAGVRIRPVDSEHSAIWQSLGRSNCDDVSSLILTASGGPFRNTPASKLTSATALEALSHPTWNMGSKVTIDSATLMNKGLEVIEAHWLFGIPFEQIEVIVHPESIVHSLVEFTDMSQVAQLSLPDMRLPIQYALTYPDRAQNTCRQLSLTEVGTLRFEAPDLARFPCLTLARQAGIAGMTYPTVLSAADEIAVEAFTEGRISFPGIAEIVKRALDSHEPENDLTWESIARADTWARSVAGSIVASS